MTETDAALLAQEWALTKTTESPLVTELFVKRLMALVERQAARIARIEAAAREVVTEMAYLFDRDNQDEATLVKLGITDALAYRRLAAALREDT